jgi:NAD(P)-dependent dehydrogenase (short-subunit alcohol dehydrogenase family)
MACNPLDLSGRRILITGASSGIGRETAKLIDQLNGTVVLSGRDPGRLHQTLSVLEGDGHVALPFDLTEGDAIPAWVKSLTSNGKPLNGMVHSAGIHSMGSLRSLSMNGIDQVMRANVHSAAMLARGFAQKGCHVPGDSSIVFLSSVVAQATSPALSLYSASKAALQGLSRSLALELAPAIRVNCLCPALVETEMTQQIRDKMLPEQFEAAVKMHPLGLGTPQDVAHAAAFLLASTGRWITGTNLILDGGYTAH